MPKFTNDSPSQYVMKIEEKEKPCTSYQELFTSELPTTSKIIYGPGHINFDTDCKSDANVNFSYQNPTSFDKPLPSQLSGENTQIFDSVNILKQSESQIKRKRGRPPKQTAKIGL